MRTLAAALTAAQRASQRRPNLKVVISDRFAGIRRVRPVEWYAGSETQGFHGSACSGDGSLNRIRNDATKLWHSRVTSPAAGSTYSSWTEMAVTAGPAAIAMNASGFGIMLLVDSAAPANVYEFTTTDHGATWSPLALAFTHAETVTMIACGVKPDNTVVAVVNRTGGNLTAYRRSAAGAWAAGVSTTTNDMTPTGVAVHYASDFNVLWTGTPTAGGSRLASRIFGDGFSQALDTWSVSRTIVESAPSSNVVYATPFLGQPDVYRLTCREQYTGTGAFDRITHSLSPATADFASNLWADLRPLNHTETFGLALSWNSTHLFLTNARKVYAHALAVTSQDVTADVVAAEVLDRPFSERLGWVELDNSDVAYTTLALLTEGAEVAVSPGYYDAAGVALQSDGPVYWVTDIEFDTTVQPPVCRLWLGSVWAWLGKASLGRSLQHAAAAKSLFGIIQDLLARVGPFEFSSTGSSAALGNLTPAALVAPGAALLPALKRLIERSDDTLYNRGQFVFANQAQAADAADETYRFPHTTTTHPVTSARLRSGRRRHNYVRVLGGATGDVVGEAIEYSEVLNYYAGPLLVADRELTTGVLAGDRASAIARRQDIESRRDLIVAPVHCGLEVNDVIDVLDTRAGGTARKVRVRSLELRYRRGRAPVYEHRLEVGEA